MIVVPYAGTRGSCSTPRRSGRSSSRQSFPCTGTGRRRPRTRSRTSRWRSSRTACSSGSRSSPRCRSRSSVPGTPSGTRTGPTPPCSCPSSRTRRSCNLRGVINSTYRLWMLRRKRLSYRLLFNIFYYVLFFIYRPKSQADPLKNYSCVFV